MDFIGFAESQKALHVQGEELSSHDELMCNFFAQPDALAIGKTAQELMAEGVRSDLVAHRTFKGNRPSLSLLMPRLDAFTTGQLLALYEHRTAVQVCVLVFLCVYLCVCGWMGVFINKYTYM